MKQDSPHRDTRTQEILEGLARLHPFVLLANADGTIEWMNERLRARFDDDSLHTFVPRREQLAALRDELETPTSSGTVSLDLANEKGARVCIEASAFAVTDEAPDDPHYVVIARPPGERNASSRALEGTVSLLSQILESSPNGVVATDRSGYITYANPKAAAFVGRDRRDLVGRPATIFATQIRALPTLLEKLRRPAGWEGEEIEVVGADGSVWLSVSTRRLLDDAGQDAGIVTYLQDITERRLVKEELERKNLELESYVDSVAHDLRSPLVSLLGFTRLLREDYETSLDETAHHFLDRVEDAGRTMDALIHDLLELSRIRKPGDLRPSLDPRSVLQQVATDLKLRLEEQGIELLLPTTPPMMQVDGTRLYQVFSNLVGNAVKHAFAGDARYDAPRISVEIREVAGGHEIVVSDNGRGLPEEDHARIFQVFQTGRGVRRSQRSHGIGLAIVKKVAEAHGGRVWVASGLDRGLRFHVLFPVSATQQS